MADDDQGALSQSLAEETVTCIGETAPPGGRPPSGAGSTDQDQGPSGSSQPQNRGSRDDVGFASSALHAEEAARARGWAWAVNLLCLAALAFLIVLPGTPVTKAIMAVSLTSLLSVGIWAWHRARDESTYTKTVFRVFGWTAATSSFGITYYLGVFSPTPLVVTLGISFFGLGLDRVSAIVIPAYAMAGYFIMSVLITVGVLPDASVQPGDGMSVIARVFFVVMVPLIYLLTLWMARLSRRTMIDALDRATRALVLANQREAQLAEVRQNLEQALKAGVGQAGQYTGSRAGDYELAELIGRGAMGDVYRGQGARGEQAAVKMLRLEALTGRAMLERFFREGEIMSQLRSPNVVNVFEMGKLADGMPFIVMELLQGDELAASLRKRGRLPLKEVRELVEQIAMGLDAAHGAGVVHRDLKPQNIFQHRPPGAKVGIWKILDFGVSRLVGSGGTLTQNRVVGTPGYMCPEQAQGRVTDGRGDIFSLGAVAYRALTGAPPFHGTNLPNTLYQITYRQPRRPSQLAPGLSEDVERVIAVAMAKDPAERFASGAEFSAALTAAFQRQLSSDIAQRASELLARHPWGQTAKAP
jgi:eukaryotic-like serine/threonine-protein kinase